MDALITNDPNVCLGIYVADCCAVYLVDPRRRVAALLHAGRKGAEAGIAPAAVERMQTEFGSAPADLWRSFMLAALRRLPNGPIPPGPPAPEPPLVAPNDGRSPTVPLPPAPSSL